MSEPFTHRVPTRGSSTRLAVHEQGEGPLVVLVHGAGGSAETSFVGLVPALVRSGHRVVAVDLPGRATAPLGGWTIEGVADVLAATVRDLGERPAVVVGHSLGGVISASMAARHPCVTSELLLAAVPHARDGRLPLVTGLWRHLFATDRRALAQHLVLTTASRTWVAGLDPVDVSSLVEMAEYLVSEDTDVHLELAGTGDPAADLERITARITVVLGDEDVLVPLDAWGSAAVAGRVDRLTWRGGHDVLAQNQQEAAALVARLAARAANGSTTPAPVAAVAHGRP